MSGELSQFEQTVGRYLLFGEIGAGGMATVHLGRLVGPAGFSKLVAIKRMHPHLAKERAFVHSFLDEARIAARVNHPNVVSIHDVVVDAEQVLLVMDYVHGRALSQLLSAARPGERAVPPPIAATIVVDLLHGLHAAHTARDERGKLLALVHRDVSPQNVLVGVDGVSRVLDFGIAHALGRLSTTMDGAVKGKLAYMAPERLIEKTVSPSVDIYAAAIVFWEMLVGERYFGGSSETVILPKVMAPEFRHLPTKITEAHPGLDAVLERALSRRPDARFATCSDFGREVEGAVDVASRVDVAAWVMDVGGEALAERAAAIEEIERSSVPSMPVAERTTGPAVRTARSEEPTAHTNAAVVAITPRVATTSTARFWKTALTLAGFALAALGVTLAERARQTALTPLASAATEPASFAVRGETSMPTLGSATQSSLVPSVDIGVPSSPPSSAASASSASNVTADRLSGRRPPPSQAPIADAGVAPRAVDAGKRPDLDAPTDRK